MRTSPMVYLHFLFSLAALSRIENISHINTTDNKSHRPVVKSERHYVIPAG